MYSRSTRLYDTYLHRRQISVYPGSLSYDILEFMLANRLSSHGVIWYSNVSPLVEKHGSRRILNAINRLRTNMWVEICKPTNKQYLRPHVWQLSNPDKIRLYPRGPKT